MHRQQIITLFLFLTCLGQTVIECVINGKKVPDGAMPYMASVQNIMGYICGGFLVSEDFVLTAANCFDNHPTSVILGSHNIKNPNNGQKIQITKKIKHPSYQHEGTGDDLMLLKLSEKAVLGNGVDTIKLPDANMRVEEGELCQVAGWGATRTHGGSVDELMATDVSIIDISTCTNAWGGLPDKVICAGGYTSERGFCQGDSGGPLVCRDTAVGVVSFNRHQNCNYQDEVPNVYVDISKYLPWIHKFIDVKMCVLM